MDEKVYCFFIIYCRVIFFQLFLWLWIILILARGNVGSFNVHFIALRKNSMKMIVLCVFNVP